MSTIRTDPLDSRIEAIIGVMMTRRKLARQAAKRLKPQCTDPLPAACVDWLNATTAAEVWHAAYQLVLPLLKGSRP